VLTLGLKFADWLIVGGNARTTHLLQALCQVIMDHQSPDMNTSADLSRLLDARLKPLISYIVACRPLSIGMGNAIRSPCVKPCSPMCRGVRACLTVALRHQAHMRAARAMSASSAPACTGWPLRTPCTLLAARTRLSRAQGCSRQHVRTYRKADRRAGETRWLKSKIAHVPPNLSVSEGKEYLQDHIHTYLDEKIVFADRIIAKVARLHPLRPCGTAALPHWSCRHARGRVRAGRKPSDRLRSPTLRSRTRRAACPLGAARVPACVPAAWCACVANVLSGAEKMWCRSAQLAREP
jgi:hypothetical protein